MQETCPTLNQAISRYIYLLNDLYELARKNRNNKTKTESDENNFLGTIMELRVELSAPCEDYPHFDMDEICKYLNISTEISLSRCE